MEPSESSTRALTLEEAVSFAIILQKNEQLTEAHELFRRIIEAAPDHPRALHYAGVLAHQQGRNDEALALIERSLALAPDQADWCSNRGIVLQSDDLGVLLRATGRPVEAEAEYREAIRLNPEHIDAYTNLGILLNSLKRTGEAAACYCKVITLRPKYREARKLLALAHCTLGEFGKAAQIFEQWLEEEPDDPIARHMLAACTGRDVPARASNGFVEATFDSFASSFEAKLAILSYRAPALVAAMVEDSGLAPSHRLDVLDAGCGTGLCGAAVAPFARRLVGVDLSDGMLAHARDKNVYHALIKAELAEYAGANREGFDLIVSADTLVYFGDLTRVIMAFAGALRPHGLLVFTLEHAAGDADDYRLQPHGRYSHARAYVERLLTLAGLRSHIIQAELRMEAGAPVPGLVVRAEKPGR